MGDQGDRRWLFFGVVVVVGVLLSIVLWRSCAEGRRAPVAHGSPAWNDSAPQAEARSEVVTPAQRRAEREAGPQQAFARGSMRGPLETGYAGMELRTVDRATGAPIGGLPVYVGEGGVGRTVRTDDRGMAWLENLPAGVELSVRFDAWNARSVTLPADQWTEVVLRCMPPIQLEVTVVDPGGRPLRGVKVTVDGELPSNAVVQTRTTGSDGVCRFGRVNASLQLTAEDRGRRGYRSFALLPPGTHSVRLVLEDARPVGGPAVLDVTVVDAQGQGVPDARVSVLGVVHRTTERGEVRIENLPARSIRVGVAANASRGLASATESVELSAGTHAIRVGLVAAAMVDVQVVDAEGEAVPFAMVAAGERAAQFERADATGSARLMVRPGECRLSASLDNVGEASTTLTLEPGQHTEWTARLGRGRVVAGQVIGPAGEGIEGLTVSMRGGRDRTGEQGRFVMTNVATGEQVVSVAPEGWFSTPLARHRLPAGPVAGPLVIQVDPDAPSASLRARFAFGDPRWRSMLWVILESEDLGFNKPLLLDEDNAVRIDRLMPSTYSIRVVTSPAAERRAGLTLPAAHTFGPFELAARQAKDLGTLSIAAACEVDLRVRWGELERRPLRVELYGDDGSLQGAGRVRAGQSHKATAGEDRVRLFSPPAPGRYLAVVRGKGIDSRAQPVEFRAGEANRAVLQLRAVRGAKLRIELPAGGQRSYAMQVFDDGGQLVTAGFGLASSVDDRAVNLAPGTYRFVVTCERQRRELLGTIVANGEQPPLVVRF